MVMLCFQWNKYLLCRTIQAIWLVDNLGSDQWLKFLFNCQVSSHMRCVSSVGFWFFPLVKFVELSFFYSHTTELTPDSLSGWTIERVPKLDYHCIVYVAFFRESLGYWLKCYYLLIKKISLVYNLLIWKISLVSHSWLGLIRITLWSPKQMCLQPLSVMIALESCRHLDSGPIIPC